MKQKRIILVTGATGAQGGSVARALLKDKKFRVRILTRNPSSSNALALQFAGAEVVQGDLGDLGSLKQAMTGCHGVFGVTNYWEHYEREFQHGKNLIEAVKQLGIKHFVMSSQMGYQTLSGGWYSVPQHDIKAVLEAYAKGLHIPVTFVHPAFYYENFLNLFPLQKNTQGYTFGFPQGDARLPMVSVEDLGGVVTTIFHHPAAYLGRVVGVVGANATCEHYASVMSKVLGVPVRYEHVPHDVFSGMNIPNAAIWATMFEVQRLHLPGQQIQLIESYGLNPAMSTFEKWLTRNRHQFPAAAARQMAFA